MRRYDSNGAEVTDFPDLWSDSDAVASGTVKDFSDLDDWIEANYDQIEGGSDRDKVRIGYLLAVKDILGDHVPTGRPCWQRGESFDGDGRIITSSPDFNP